MQGLWGVGVSEDGGCAPKPQIQQQRVRSITMYQFSRAIYRELAPEILAAPRGGPATSNQTAVLRACEDVITRLATDRHYFARPARTLFCDIRSYLDRKSTRLNSSH